MANGIHKRLQIAKELGKFDRNAIDKSKFRLTGWQRMGGGPCCHMATCSVCLARSSSSSYPPLLQNRAMHFAVGEEGF